MAADAPAACSSASSVRVAFQRRAVGGVDIRRRIRHGSDLALNRGACVLSVSGGRPPASGTRGRRIVDSDDAASTRQSITSKARTWASALSRRRSRQMRWRRTQFRPLEGTQRSGDHGTHEPAPMLSIEAPAIGAMAARQATSAQPGSSARKQAVGLPVPAERTLKKNRTTESDRRDEHAGFADQCWLKELRSFESSSADDGLFEIVRMLRLYDIQPVAGHQHFMNPLTWVMNRNIIRVGPKVISSTGRSGLAQRPPAGFHGAA